MKLTPEQLADALSGSSNPLAVVLQAAIVANNPTMDGDWWDTIDQHADRMIDILGNLREFIAMTLHENEPEPASDNDSDQTADNPTADSTKSKLTKGGKPHLVVREVSLATMAILRTSWLKSWISSMAMSSSGH